MSIKQILCIALLVFALSAAAVYVMIGSANTAFAECNALSAKFKEYGAAVEECEFDAEDNQIKVSFKSAADAERLSAEDISAIRAVRNVVRYEMGTLKTLSGAAGYNEVMTNSAGKVLINSDIDLQTVPPFPECGELKKNIPAAKDIEELCGGLTAEYPNITLDTAYNENYGTILKITLDSGDADFDAVNQDIADIMRCVDKYNRDSAAVQQTELDVYAGGERILFGSFDLVYRDFLWWQTPQMSDTWTHY